MSTVSWFRRVLLRDIDTLVAQVRAYPSDDALWAPVDGIANPGGALIHHVCGNLRHFIGARIGTSGFVRDRDAEFADRGIPQDALEAMAVATRADVEAGLDHLRDDQLDETFVEPVGGATFTTGQFLVHATAHLAYHLGQIDYHRRVVTGGAPVPGMQASTALVDE